MEKTIEINKTVKINNIVNGMLKGEIQKQAFELKSEKPEVLEAIRQKYIDSQKEAHKSLVEQSEGLFKELLENVPQKDYGKVFDETFDNICFNSTHGWFCTKMEFGDHYRRLTYKGGMEIVLEYDFNYETWFPTIKVSFDNYDFNYVKRPNDEGYMVWSETKQNLHVGRCDSKKFDEYAFYARTASEINPEFDEIAGLIAECKDEEEGEDFEEAKESQLSDRRKHVEYFIGRGEYSLIDNDKFVSYWNEIKDRSWHTIFDMEMSDFLTELELGGAIKEV